MTANDSRGSHRFRRSSAAGLLRPGSCSDDATDLFESPASRESCASSICMGDQLCVRAIGRTEKIAIDCDNYLSMRSNYLGGSFNVDAFASSRGILPQRW